MMRAPPAWDPSWDASLQRLSARVTQQYGLHYPRERWHELVRGISAATHELGCHDARECLRRLLAETEGSAHLDILAQHLSVGETYFFRDPACFRALENHVLPELLSRRRQAPEAARRIRMWSAGCSSGEEAYSLAITLARMVPDLTQWNVSILGTDIHARGLAKASEGLYGPWSFRQTEPGLRSWAFDAEGEGRYRVKPRLRALVTFAPLNLAQPVYPSPDTHTNAMDVILCRNVLMYFQRERVPEVVDRLSRCLADGGWLIVSAAEASLIASPAMTAERLPEALLFRKQAAPPGRAGRRPEPGRYSGKAAPSARPGPTRREPAHSRAPTGTLRMESASAPLRNGGDYAKAAEELRALLASEPQHAEAMALLARALANQAKLDEALMWCERAIAADTLDAGRSYLRASILLEQGRLDAAADAYRRTLYLDARRPLAHFCLANVLMRQGRRSAALRHYRQVMALLDGLPPGQTLPDSGGMASGALMDMVESILERESS